MNEKKISKFNIAQYLENCFIDKIEPNELIMKNVDFQEVSKINVKYKLEKEKNREIQLTIEETLAQNCINYLPFEAYEKYITADWIEYTKDYESKLVNNVIYHYNGKLLKKLHNLCVEKSLVDETFSNIYISKFIEPLMNINQILLIKNKKITKDFIDIYYDLFKKTSEELDYFRKISFIPKRKQNLNKLTYKDVNSDWLKKIISLNNYREDKKTIINKLLKTLATNKEYKNIFEDVFVQILKEYENKQEIKVVFGIGQTKENNYNKLSLENILSVTIRNKNYECSELIINTLDLSEKQIVAAYDENIMRDIDCLDRKELEPIENVFLKYLNKDYFNIKNKFFNTEESKFFSLFVLSKNKEQKDIVLKNKKKYFNQNLFEHQTSSLEFYICLAKIVECYSQSLNEEGKLLTWSSKNKGNNDIAMYFAEFLLLKSPFLLEEVDIKKISDKIWIEIENKKEILLNCSIIKDKITKKEIIKNPIMFDLWIKKLKLDCQLNNNENNIQDNKLNQKKFKI